MGCQVIIIQITQMIILQRQFRKICLRETVENVEEGLSSFNSNNNASITFDRGFNSYIWRTEALFVGV